LLGVQEVVKSPSGRIQTFGRQRNAKSEERKQIPPAFLGDSTTIDLGKISLEFLSVYRIIPPRGHGSTNSRDEQEGNGRNETGRIVARETIYWRLDRNESRW